MLEFYFYLCYTEAESIRFNFASNLLRSEFRSRFEPTFCRYWFYKIILPPPLTCPVPARQNLTSPLTCKTGFQSKIKRVGSNPPFDQSFRVVLPFSNVEIFLKNFNNLFSIIVLVYVICTNINSLFLTSANFKCLNYLRFWQYRRNSRVSKGARPFCLRVADTKSKPLLQRATNETFLRV